MRPLGSSHGGKRDLGVVLVAGRRSRIQKTNKNEQANAAATQNLSEWPTEQTTKTLKKFVCILGLTRFNLSKAHFEKL